MSEVLPGMEKAALKAAAAVRMPFGKHRGVTLGWIGGNDPEYLGWLVSGEIMITTPGLKEAAERVHREVTRRADGV